MHSVRAALESCGIPTISSTATVIGSIGPELGGSTVAQCKTKAPKMPHKLTDLHCIVYSRLASRVSVNVITKMVP